MSLAHYRPDDFRKDRRMSDPGTTTRAADVEQDKRPFKELAPEHRDNLVNFCRVMAGINMSGIRAMFLLALAKKHPDITAMEVLESALATMIVGLRHTYYGRDALQWVSIVQLAELGSNEFGGEDLRRLLPKEAWPRPDTMQALHDAYQTTAAEMLATDEGF